MNWKTSGNPHQLEVNIVLETEDSGIAKILSDSFYQKDYKYQRCYGTST